MYLFATLTTSLRLCSTSSCFDRRDVFLNNSSSLISCEKVFLRGEICTWKKMCTYVLRLTMPKRLQSSKSEGSLPSSFSKNWQARVILECSWTCVASKTSSSLFSTLVLPISYRKFATPCLTCIRVRIKSSVWFFGQGKHTSPRSKLRTLLLTWSLCSALRSQESSFILTFDRYKPNSFYWREGGGEGCKSVLS